MFWCSVCLVGWVELKCVGFCCFNFVEEYGYFGGRRREMFCIYVMGVRCMLGVIFIIGSSYFEGEIRCECEGG